MPLEISDGREKMINKNDIFDVKIVDQGNTGEGIGKKEGYTLFVDFALPGEVIETKVLKANKNYGFGKIMKIKQVSEDRIEAPCVYYDQCGGCQIQHQSYESQKRFKQKRVQDALERIGDVSDFTVDRTLGMENPFRYRNKVQIPFARVNGKVVAGFYARGSHRIVNVEECIVQHEDGDRVLSIVRNWVEEFKITTYENDLDSSKKGLLRHLVIRKGFNTGDLMVVLVVSHKDVPHLDVLLDELKKIKGFKSLFLNLNNKETNVVMGDKNILIYGQETIEDTISDLKFKISPHSFFQVNPEQTEVIYEKALEYADLIGDEVIFDAYCGAGTISLFLAQKAKKVYGIEIVPEAIIDAKENALRNLIANAEFILGKSEEVIVDLLGQGIKADVMVVDPPRKGCDEKLLQAIGEMVPEKIVYVSCNPGSLARDIKILSALGYELSEATPVDNFPQSSHVETVVLLSRVEK